MIVSRKAGPSGGYLWQYLLEDDGTGHVQLKKVPESGKSARSPAGSRDQHVVTRQ